MDHSRLNFWQGNQDLRRDYSFSFFQFFTSRNLFDGLHHTSKNLDVNKHKKWNLGVNNRAKMLHPVMYLPLTLFMVTNQGKLFKNALQGNWSNLNVIMYIPSKSLKYINQYMKAFETFSKDYLGLFLSQFFLEYNFARLIENLKASALIHFSRNRFFGGKYKKVRSRKWLKHMQTDKQWFPVATTTLFVAQTNDSRLINVFKHGTFKYSVPINISYAENTIVFFHSTIKLISSNFLKFNTIWSYIGFIGLTLGWGEINNYFSVQLNRIMTFKSFF